MFLSFVIQFLVIALMLVMQYVPFARAIYRLSRRHELTTDRAQAM